MMNINERIEDQWRHILRAAKKKRINYLDVLKASRKLDELIIIKMAQR